MTRLILLALLGLAACTSGPATFPVPSVNDPSWQLNGAFFGTDSNALLTPPPYSGRLANAH